MIYFYNSMRYSRLLEESSFANRKADYFWLLFQSAVLLLVCPLLPSLPFIKHSPMLGLIDNLPPSQPPLPFLPTRLRPHLPLVTSAPLHTHLPLWLDHHHRTLPSSRARRSCVGAKWYLESSCWGFGWVCGWPFGVVH